MIDLTDKIALITGAGNPAGIGRRTARRFAELGARIVLTDVVDDGLADGAARLGEEHGVGALAVPLDVTDPSSIAAAMAVVKREWGGLDILVNNAAGVFGAPTPLHQYDEADWSRTLDVTLNGVVRVSQAAVPLMERRSGVIVNIASRAGKRPAELNGAYSVAKAGVIMVSKVMATELASLAIRVNAVCPGLIDTDLQVLNVALKAHVMGVDEQEARRRLLETVPMGRMGTVDEVADLVAYLASPGASYVTGQAINIGGGLQTEL
ncbi:MAG: SDR family oxidoreductase [Actinomycetia bacterium]|nr:SDR family oxidoreductase [Actinomycetes bacterium]MCP4958798.1 SDR family oxidoreductase [Actinomycetes bacterium]